MEFSKVKIGLIRRCLWLVHLMKAFGNGERANKSVGDLKMLLKALQIIHNEAVTGGGWPDDGNCV